MLCPRCYALLAVPILLGAGCFARVKMGPSQIQSLDCESGAFEVDLPVQRRGGKAKIVYEFLPGEENLTHLKRQPERQVLRGRDREANVKVRGKLVDRCADGGVTMLASFPPGGSTAFVDVDSVLAASSPDSARSEPGRRDFSYVVTFQCCGPEAASTFAVSAEAVEGVDRIVTQPSSFACNDDETVNVEVSGELSRAEQPGRARVLVVDRTSELQCGIEDAIEPGSDAASATSTQPADPDA